VHQALEGYRETEATIHRVYPALNYPGIIYSTHIRFYETKYTKSTKGPIFSDDTSVDRLHNGILYFLDSILLLYIYSILYI